MSQLYIVEGKRGCGKTTYISRWVREAPMRCGADLATMTVEGIERLMSKGYTVMVERIGQSDIPMMRPATISDLTRTH